MKNRKAGLSPAFSRSWIVPLCAAVVFFLAFGFLLAGGAAAQSTAGRTITGNTPGMVSIAKNMGPEASSKTITVTLWLQPHNRAALDTLAEQLYDKTSPNYHKWLKPAELKAQFAPTAEDVSTVKQFLTEHNLKVQRVGPANLSVTAEGTVAEVEKAFAVKINKFQLGTEMHRANLSDPFIEGPAGNLVSAVYGMDDPSFKQPLKRNTDVHQFAGKAPAANTMAHANSASGAALFSPQCFTGVETQTFTTSGALPFGTYTGNGYGQPVTGGGPGTLAPCGYVPSEIYTAYNLNGLYGEGFHGEGQTIVILDFFGSPYVLQDANVFNAMNNLPPLTPANFSTVFFPFNCECGGIDIEENLDVEWAHAIAPGANIILLINPTGTLADVDNDIVFAVTEGLGNVISGSFGFIESELSPTVLNAENLIAEFAAVLGVSTNYSSGDTGDFTPLGIPATVLMPADLPFATGVGGVSLALNSDSTMAWQAGWGNNITGIVAPPFDGGFVSDPPLNFGFNGGSGGGQSGFFAKPKFQLKVPGGKRQVPDIAWLADPFTGVEVVAFDGFGEAVGIVGGTSLSTPMFSALWAIANQEAGGGPLGQAAPILYEMPAGTITDVIPVGSPTNPTGIIQDSTGFHHFTAAQLAAPLDGTTKFYSAIYNSPFDFEWDIVTFGTDTSLKTHPGWDNVTGLGTPNGQAFADFFAAAPATKK
jgi:subtilase family serine protease